MKQVDIAERLRRPRWVDPATGKYCDNYDLAGVEAERLEAADMIARLRGLNEGQCRNISFLDAEIERLEALLRGTMPSSPFRNQRIATKP